MVTGLVASEFDAQLNLGTSGAEFDQVELATPISLSAGKGITIHGQSIQARANITTDNGALNWNAVGDISISGRILTNGGAQTLTADSDGDGTGKFSLDFAIAELIDPNPNPGNRFGSQVVILNSGNIVVTSPYDDAGGIDAGAVYLFNGLTGALISTLTGSSANERVGIGGVTALSNGNYVVRSPYWSNGVAVDAGAVTWGSGTSGVSGVLSSLNSLVGSSSSDNIGGSVIYTLSNGSYVVISHGWDNGSAVDAGAVTWGSGTSGVSGEVSSLNSLVGSTSYDYVGFGGFVALSNGNFVVRSSNWHNGSAVSAGAVTWGSGTSGVSGVVSAINSLVGSTSGDSVGNGNVHELSNGNYVVRSPYWDNGVTVDAGAVTWGSGTSGVSGIVSSSNSLVGSTYGDVVGGHGFTALSNGNYVVISQGWDNGSAVDAGAVTWGSGTSGVSGVVSSSNSLVGSASYDYAGNYGVIALSNGNYVVRSPYWDNGVTVDAGAVTWGSGTSGVSGIVSSSNSLVGSTYGDVVGGHGFTALSNGNYLANSPSWDNGSAVDAGAVTWGNGSSGVVGEVSSLNSLVGTNSGNQVGFGGVVPLSNGNYVVRSYYWDNGGATDAGAVTWVMGAVASLAR